MREWGHDEHEHEHQQARRHPHHRPRRASRARVGWTDAWDAVTDRDMTEMEWQEYRERVTGRWAGVVRILRVGLDTGGILLSERAGRGFARLDELVARGLLAWTSERRCELTPAGRIAAEDRAAD
jgi:hypothetical protein